MQPPSPVTSHLGIQSNPSWRVQRRWRSIGDGERMRLEDSRASQDAKQNMLRRQPASIAIGDVDHCHRRVQRHDCGILHTVSQEADEVAGVSCAW